MFKPVSFRHVANFAIIPTKMKGPLMPITQHTQRQPTVASQVRQLGKKLARLTEEFQSLQTAMAPTPRIRSKQKSVATAGPLDFYARVRVTHPSADHTEIAGALGTVLGRARRGQRWTYTVFVDTQEECWTFSAQELAATGEHDSKERFSGRSSIRVHVDDRGHGTIINK
jgi:hypothetical protein